MKSLRDDIKKIWKECFDDSREYVEMYFDRIFQEADVMTLENDGSIVSSLLLQPYTFRYQDLLAGMSYIAGAATRRAARGKGYMSQLVIKALHESRKRGDILCTLIPAHDWLYFYYDRFGFTTIFYNDRQRFTSLHKFQSDGQQPDNYTPEPDNYSDKVFEAFQKLEQQRGCGVVHSRRDFLNTLDDLSFDSDGTFVAINDESGKTVSMAWAITENGLVLVKEILAADDNARLAALRYLRSRFPDKPFMILAPAEDNLKRHLYSRGMGRLVNVEKCLAMAAAANTDMKSHIKVTDNLITDNTHIYRIADGKSEIDDEYTGELDLDVSIETMTEIVFSSPKIGGIIGFPSERPHMSLMLD